MPLILIALLFNYPEDATGLRHAKTMSAHADNEMDGTRGGGVRPPIPCNQYSINTESIFNQYSINIQSTFNSIFNQY